MSLVALIMNLLLGGLLLAALGLGWRLERRLKALRDSQTSFAAAIADLDRAATRAEQGLADLRAATDEANEALAGRIERAQVLSQRLDGAMTRAAAAPAREPPQNREFSRDPATRAEQLAARLELGLPRDEAPRRAEPLRPEMPRAREVRTDLILEDDDTRRPFTPRPPVARAPAFPPTPQPSRSRARVDDELFEDRGGQGRDVQNRDVRNAQSRDALSRDSQNRNMLGRDPLGRTPLGSAPPGPPHGLPLGGRR